MPDADTQHPTRWVELDGRPVRVTVEHAYPGGLCVTVEEGRWAGVLMLVPAGKCSPNAPEGVRMMPRRQRRAGSATPWPK